MIAFWLYFFLLYINIDYIKKDDGVMELVMKRQTSISFFLQHTSKKAPVTKRLGFFHTGNDGFIIFATRLKKEDV